MNQTIKLINERASLRKFSDRELSSEDKDTIIQSALRAPTAGNMMLYSIIIVTEQDKKEILSKTCDEQPFIATAPLVMVFLADLQRWYDYYRLSAVEKYCQEQDKDFRGPGEADLLLASSDALIAAQTAVIAAESLGIGSCYIGDIMENYEKHRNLFNLPDYTFPIAMLVMGYYSEKRPVTKPRFASKYIVFEDKYQRLGKEEFTNMYADISSKFNRDNQFKADNIGQLVYARKTGSDFSQEMARSVKVALKNWQRDKI